MYILPSSRVLSSELRAHSFTCSCSLLLRPQVPSLCRMPRLALCCCGPSYPSLSLSDSTLSSGPLCLVPFSYSTLSSWLCLLLFPACSASLRNAAVLFLSHTLLACAWLPGPSESLPSVVLALPHGHCSAHALLPARVALGRICDALTSLLPYPPRPAR